MLSRVAFEAQPSESPRGAGLAELNQKSPRKPAQIESEEHSHLTPVVPDLRASACWPCCFASALEYHNKDGSLA